jgi:hypothetical protein
VLTNCSCGLWINNVGQGSRYDGTHSDFIGKGIGNCSDWTDYRTWDEDKIQNVLDFTINSMDALQVGRLLLGMSELTDAELLFLDVEDWEQYRKYSSA